MNESQPRKRLPNRRRSVTHEITIEGKVYAVTFGYYPDSGIAEVFIAGAKTGSEMDAMLSDGAILASLALQHGTPPAALAKTMSRLPTDDLDRLATRPASPLGAAMDLLALLTVLRNDQGLSAPDRVVDIDELE